MSKARSSSPLSSVRALLLDVLDCAFDRQSWHGANLTSATRGVRAAQAARVVLGRRCIWEQVLHAACWKNRVLGKLRGKTRPLPRKGSNWPKLPDKPSEAAWKSDLALLRAIHRELRDVVASLPDERLAHRKTTWLIHGAAAHDLYHAGQIKLLRRLTGTAKKPRP